jgi:hypothetical protein
MKKNLVSVLVLAFVGCGQVDNVADMAAQTTPAPTDVADKEQPVVSMFLHSVKDLPECSVEIQGSLAYLIDVAKFMACDNFKWVLVDIEGKEGQKGQNGERGEKGDVGTRGEKGEKGDRGEAGIAGATGERGENGDTGAAGTQGEQGQKGDTGERGEKGEQGEAGVAGVAGAQGEQGIAGANGIDGQDGTSNRITKNQLCNSDSGSDVLQWQVAQTAAGDVFLNISRTTAAYNNSNSGWFKADEAATLKLYWVYLGNLTAYTYTVQWDSNGNAQLLRCNVGAGCTGSMLYHCSL